jgi:mono/diheme cytochrome c family protein
MTATTPARIRWSDHPWCRFAVVATLVIQALTAAFLAWEQTWGEPRKAYGGQTTFVAGSVGTEFIPLVVLEVLPGIDPDAFPEPTKNKAGALEGGWIAKYGFVERRGDEPTFPPTEPELASLLAGDEELRSLPVGFTLTKVRPFTPDPAPLRFVGLACAGCHSARLPDAGPSGKIVYGAGNPTLDLIRFFEAFRGAILKKVPKPGVDAKPVSITEGPDLVADQYEYALTLTRVKQLRAEKGLRALDPAEQLMVWFWLLGTQTLAEANTKKYDLPPTPDQLLLPRFNAVGPGRTQPFVTLDNEVLNLPAKDNKGYSKIPAVFLEGYRKWAQFDGSVADPHTRSGLAAMTAGGSVDNLGGLGVGHHIIAAADYTVGGLVGPSWSDLFGKPPGGPPAPNPVDAEEARLDETQRRGRKVYEKYCVECHGRPDPTGAQKWLKDGKYYGMIVPTIDPFDPANKPPIADWMAFPDRAAWAKQATDPERVVFRDGRVIPFILFTYFDREHPIKSDGEYYPLDHPLAIKRPEIRNSGGYVNGPLDSLFLRAPYLHNGSVPTLAQLINLEPRPSTFLRGKNVYDPDKAGVVAPAPPDDFAPKPGDPLYWLFDTSQRGNRNYGHNYPWAYGDEAKDSKALEDLLAYLKTL